MSDRDLFIAMLLASISSGSSDPTRRPRIDEPRRLADDGNLPLKHCEQDHG